jgi:transcriptional regulator with XRE-family HTH domain
METSLPEWLTEQMKERSITAAELSRKSGISAQQISRLLAGQRGVSEVSLRAISEALNIPPEVAFRVAGFLPPLPERTQQIEQLIYLFERLNEKDRQTVLDMMQFLLSK